MNAAVQFAGLVIVKATLVLFAGEIAARYLAGAGLGRIMVADAAHARCARDIDPNVLVEVSAAGSSRAVDAFDLRDEAARDLAAGARAALQVIRVVLGVHANDPVRSESEHCPDKGP